MCATIIVDKTYGVVDAAPSVDETEEDTLQSKPLGMSVGGLVADYESGEEEEEEEEGHEHKAKEHASGGENELESSA